MTLYHYIAKRAEDLPAGSLVSGVPRFDSMLRRVFPEMVSVTKPPAAKPGDVVITDNDLSLDIPDEIKTIVVMHGCAATHYERDEAWRTEKTFTRVMGQKFMLEKPNRVFVAPSAWVSSEFHRQNPEAEFDVEFIPHWVEPIFPLPKSGKPIVIGDWRNHNKGANSWQRIAEANPQWELKPLNFRDETGRREQYGKASLFLNLSLCEGFSYALADAEAAGLLIVTTDTGAFFEFVDCRVTSWQLRDDAERMAEAIKTKLQNGRQVPSFYQDYTFDKWAEAWRGLVYE